MAAHAALVDVLDGEEMDSEGAAVGPERDLQDVTAALADQRRRLNVACTQMAEFAGAKAAEAAALVAELQRLPEDAAARGAALARVVQTLAGSSAEAAALARTHGEEAARAGGGEHANGGGGEGGNGGGVEAEEEEATSAASGPHGATPLDPRASACDTDFGALARDVPVRLSLKERNTLKLLEAALGVSEYTDKVDVYTTQYGTKTTRITKQLKELCAILCGLTVASDYSVGQTLVKDRNFVDNASFFQDVFEIGRRHKILNPDKMRTEYGKLMHLLQDSVAPEVAQLMEFSLVTPLKTVEALLKRGGATALLSDPLLATAVAEIYTAGRERRLVQNDIRAKDRAREALSQRYATAAIKAEELHLCIVSLADHANYLRSARDPVDRAIALLKTYFNPKEPHAERSLGLAIAIGHDGARLSHSHERQYTYVLQSLTLWREVAADSFKIWRLAEEDLLRPGAGYRLADTGQGLNRVQQAPATGRAMHALLQRCQATLGAWVGSSVIHLGDHNVPNALVLLDKYAQVPRFMGPVMACVDGIDALASNPGLASYISSSFGGAERLKRLILADFFRHAFDGSGADSFFDAGSCIDGRLTSAWNWCDRIATKPFYPIFLLTGFTSFDGNWQK